MLITYKHLSIYFARVENMVLTQTKDRFFCFFKDLSGVAEYVFWSYEYRANFIIFKTDLLSIQHNKRQQSARSKDKITKYLIFAVHWDQTSYISAAFIVKLTDSALERNIETCINAIKFSAGRWSQDD